jgi:hypothetical protein
VQPRRQIARSRIEIFASFYFDKRGLARNRKPSLVADQDGMLPFGAGSAGRLWNCDIMCGVGIENSFRRRSNFQRMCRYPSFALFLTFLAAVGAGPAAGQSQPPATQSAGQQDAQPDEPEANPARPTVSNPATLTPIGYLQFEVGALGAMDSSEFSNRVEFNEVIKLAVSRRIEFIEASEPAVHYTVNGVSANGIAEVFLGTQVVFLPGEGAKPTISASYSRRIYGGGAPDLDVGSPLNSAVLYASADVKGFHYDANAVFNEVLEGPVRRLQFGQTLSISHPLGKGFGLSGEIWRFTQPFQRGNAIGNLWAASYAARKNLVFDAGFEKGLTGTSTHWEAFAGLTYLLPHRLWGR